MSLMLIALHFNYIILNEMFITYVTQFITGLRGMCHIFVSKMINHFSKRKLLIKHLIYPVLHSFKTKIHYR